MQAKTTKKPLYTPITRMRIQSFSNPRDITIQITSTNCASLKNIDNIKWKYEGNIET